MVEPTQTGTYTTTAGSTPLAQGASPAYKSSSLQMSKAAIASKLLMGVTHGLSNSNIAAQVSLRRYSTAGTLAIIISGA